jgi:hypothetical protein
VCGTESATPNEKHAVGRNGGRRVVRDLPDVVGLGTLTEKDEAMKTVEWVAVVTVLGVGIGSQLLQHDHDAVTGHDHGSAMNMEMAGDNHAMVTLAVTGMT